MISNDLCDFSDVLRDRKGGTGIVLADDVIARLSAIQYIDTDVMTPANNRIICKAIIDVSPGTKIRPPRIINCNKMRVTKVPSLVHSDAIIRLLPQKYNRGTVDINDPILSVLLEE